MSVNTPTITDIATKIAEVVGNAPEIDQNELSQMIEDWGNTYFRSYDSIINGSQPKWVKELFEQLVFTLEVRIDTTMY